MKIVKWLYGLFLEKRICPGCAADPMDALMARRKTFTARCPKCGDLWD